MDRRNEVNPPGPDVIPAIHPTVEQAAGCPPALRDRQWFLMRVAYGREAKAQQILDNNGLETYLPLTPRDRVNGDTRCRQWVSLLPNLLFVHTTEQEIKPFLGGPATPFLHHYYVPHIDDRGRTVGRTGRKPLIIPEVQMRSFMLWNKVQTRHKILLLNERIDFKVDDAVRVIHGDFAGFTGHVFRLRGQQRVGINITGIGAVFTAYIPTAWIEKII